MEIADWYYGLTQDQRHNLSESNVLSDMGRQVLVALRDDREQIVILLSRPDVNSEAVRCALLNGYRIGGGLRHVAMRRYLRHPEVSLADIDSLPGRVLPWVGAKKLEELAPGCDQETLQVLLESWRGTFKELKEAVALTTL